MAEKAQIELVFAKMKQARPAEFFKCMDETQAGIGAVLRLLYESSGTVTAGMISDSLQISTARVAVLLKKMSAKGLISKERGILDARTTVVCLTSFGAQVIEEIQNHIYRQIGLAIDTVGESRLLDFIATADELRSVMEPFTFHF